eukprot:TRINITY_DN21660_c0_g1_i1.p1 TRINITY_DN21660_c0_g1~~TRINITY_DN21660_c0_g1_i1.p1  ORF type:complete len:555 (+),score=170.01 TRINITY_DN21660_c0_g1_i1:176-1840(+)
MSSTRSSKMITLRVRSSEGMKRLEGSPSSKLRSLLEGLPEHESLEFFRDQRRKEPFSRAEMSKSLSSLGLQHGDMIFAFGKPGAEAKTPEAKSTPVETQVIEDEVDQLLSREEGKIPRSKGENCRHASENAKCIHCTPLEPFDESYHSSNQIKHLSFHAYLRQMHRSGPSGGKYKVLEDISCSIKKGCRDHPSWPEGICSKCQPPAITLNQQKYRHVDNVMFENPKIVEEFLGFWRKTGKQRVGFLYGRYEVYKEVPLGIKAVVSAIYEPPQESTRDSITIVPDDKEDIVEDIAKKLGLARVGWILTDLIPSGGGNVKYIRHADTHLLSATEVISAAHFQNKYKNPCKASPSGSFGSKFVTVSVSGNAQKQIHLEGYQVSNQCMALVRENCLLPTKDAPELGWVRESSSSQYVPDVFFKETNEYGKEVMKPSRPLPVIYTLVDVPVSHPLEPLFTFPIHNSDKNPFPIENRPLEGHLQDFASLAAHRKQYKDDEIPDFFRDFHVLLFLANLSIVPLYEHMDSLCLAVKNKDIDLIKAWSDSTHWQTVEQLILYS